jgi:hypothetical protein
MKIKIILFIILFLFTFSAISDAAVVNLGDFSINEKFDEIQIEDSTGIYPVGLQFAGICGNGCILVVLLSSSPVNPGGYRVIFKSSSAGSYILKIFKGANRTNYCRYVIKQLANGNTINVTKEDF